MKHARAQRIQKESTHPHAAASEATHTPSTMGVLTVWSLAAHKPLLKNCHRFVAQDMDHDVVPSRMHVSTPTSTLEKVASAGARAQPGSPKYRMMARPAAGSKAGSAPPPTGAATQLSAKASRRPAAQLTLSEATPSTSAKACGAARHAPAT